MSADPNEAINIALGNALAEIFRRGAAIMVGERLRNVAFDLASVAAKALGVTLPTADTVQDMWQPEERQPQRRRTRR
jgi:hypothetical protein